MLQHAGDDRNTYRTGGCAARAVPASLPRGARALNDTVTVDIPYESLDPLTIGSCDDPGSVYREQLFLRIPRRNLWAWLKPNEPPALPDVTAAAVAALERPAGGPRFSELIGPDKSLAIIIDNQFRPTPTSKLLPAVFDAVERRGVRDARVVCANGKVFRCRNATPR